MSLRQLLNVVVLFEFLVLHPLLNEESEDLFLPFTSIKLNYYRSLMRTNLRVIMVKADIARTVS